MQDINDKVTTNTLTAVEWNEIPSELQNIIEAMGFTLSSGDLNQLGKAIAGMVSAADFYLETGIADVYVATKVGAKQGPVFLNEVHSGMRVRFRPGNANTGPSTVAVNGLLAKDIVDEAGVALVGGELTTLKDVELRYDWNGGTDRFFITEHTAKVTTAYQVEEMNSHFVEILADTIALSRSAAYAYDIDTLIAKTSVGSVDVTIAINGTPVTGMSAVTVDSTEDTLTATALRRVNIGDTVTMVLATLVSSPADLEWTLKTTRVDV